MPIIIIYNILVCIVVYLTGHSENIKIGPVAQKRSKTKSMCVCVCVFVHFHSCTKNKTIRKNVDLMFTEGIYYNKFFFVISVF